MGEQLPTGKQSPPTSSKKKQERRHKERLLGASTQILPFHEEDTHATNTCEEK